MLSGKFVAQARAAIGYEVRKFETVPIIRQGVQIDICDLSTPLAQAKNAEGNTLKSFILY